LPALPWVQRHGRIDEENKHMKIMPVWGKAGFNKPKGGMPIDAELQDIQAYLKAFGPAE
jgi:hypothetical protein